MKKTLLLCVAPLSVLASDLVVNIASGSSDLAPEQKTAVQNNTVTDVYKTGQGTLEPASAASFAGFTGTLHVKEGYLRLLGANWIPTTAKISVEWKDDQHTEGGTVTFYGTGNTFNTGTPIEFCGTGVGGTAGALAMDGFTTGDMDLQNTTMTGDALVTGSSGRPMRFNGSKGLDMQGFTLTSSPSSARELVVYCTVKHPGKIVVTQGSFRPGYGYAQNPGGTVELRNAASINLYNFGTRSPDYFPWDVKTDWSGTPNAVKNVLGGSSASASQHLHGNFVLNGGWTNDVLKGAGKSPYARHFHGNVSGDGAIRLNATDGWGHFYGTNTASGPLIVSLGTAIMESTNAIPRGDFAALDLANGSAAILAARPQGEASPNGFDAAWTCRFFTELWNRYGNDKYYYMYPGESGSAEVPGTMAIDGDALSHRQFPLNVCNGEVKFTASFVNHPNLHSRNWGSISDTAVLATPGAEGGEIGFLHVRQGRMRLEDAGLVCFTNEVRVTGSSTYASRLTVGANSALDQACKAYSRATPNDPVSYASIGEGGDGHRGVLEVTDGGAVTNAIKLALATKYAVGAAYVRAGGVYFNTGRAGWDTAFPGEQAEGYLEVDGGTFSTGSGFFIGGYHNNGVGVVYVKGGEFMVRGAWGSSGAPGPHVAREGVGALYQCGGTLTAPSTLWIGSGYYRNNETLLHGSTAAMTVEGTGTLARAGGTTYLGARGFCHAFLNLNEGGTLQTTDLYTPLAQPTDGKDGLRRVLSNQVTFVSFNGGRLRAGASSSTFLGAPNQQATYKYKDGDRTVSATINGDTMPNYVTVYGGGATLDSSNFTVTVHAPLVRPPTAGGIVSLDIPSGTATNNYIAAPLVKIVGDGQGASAVALFDSTNGVVTGVKITSPGWGYTAANTTAQLYHGHGKYVSTAPTPVNLQVVVGDNAQTGGLTVDGAGTVALAAANTYGGATFVKGGVLRVDRADAIPAGSQIRLGGDGLLDMNGFAVPSGCTVSIAEPESFAGRTRSVTLMQNVSGTVTVANAQDLPPLWTMAQSNGRLRAVYDIGLRVIFR